MTHAEFIIDERDELEGLAKATVFMQNDYCALCFEVNKSKADADKVDVHRIVWQANKSKLKDNSGEVTYIKRRCLECTGTSTLSQYKSGGYFWKAWEIYNSQGTGTDTDNTPPQQ